jgi:hypothetical protein
VGRRGLGRGMVEWAGGSLGRVEGDWTASWAVFAESNVSLALGKEPSFCREPGSRHRQFYSKIIIKIANRCEKFTKI